MPDAEANEEPERIGIHDLARRLGVTTRTLRFYEDRGLIQPHRSGAARIYDRRDAARLHLILRGKRVGFSLREIRDFLDLYDADPQHVEQMRALAMRCAERIAELEQRQLALAQTIAELGRMQTEAEVRIGRGQTGRGQETAMKMVVR